MTFPHLATPLHQHTRFLYMYALYTWTDGKLCIWFHPVCVDKQVAASLHTVLEPFLLRRVKTQVCACYFTSLVYYVLQKYARVIQPRYTNDYKTVQKLGDRLDHIPMPRPHVFFLCSLGIRQVIPHVSYIAGFICVIGPHSPQDIENETIQKISSQPPWAMRFEVSLPSFAVRHQGNHSLSPYRYCWTFLRRVRWSFTRDFLHCRRNTTRPSSPKTLVRPVHFLSSYLLSLDLASFPGRPHFCSEYWTQPKEQNGGGLEWGMDSHQFGSQYANW